MPVIFDAGTDKLKQWLDPARSEWNRELQSLLKPYDGELEVYPVCKDVGKVGNNSPSFIIPLDSKENKSNIANLFANALKGQGEPRKESFQVLEQQNAKDVPSVLGQIHKHPVDENTPGQKRKGSITLNESNTAIKKPTILSTKSPVTQKISSTKNYSRDRKSVV